MRIKTYSIKQKHKAVMVDRDRLVLILALISTSFSLDTNVT